ncbi:hypothetical protein OC842_000876 [Tilletia horrida]|uniref:RRM domain-containing protein n=1 Tax=Tilletia horrida TaxID=155126 RepID=A0AAN6GGN8_9BASI|nr:hypothetical protein OC842_000876 [Tilletia horrida]
MPPRPVTVVKAAPAKRKDNKSKPKFDTPNPFAALASLDDEDAFPPLGGAPAAGGTASRSSRNEQDDRTAADSSVSEDEFADSFGNASLRGSSLPPSCLPSGPGGYRNSGGGTRSVSMPLLSRLTGGIAVGRDVDPDSSSQDGNNSMSVAELMESFPGSNSVMSIFVAGLPQISMLSMPDHNHLQQDLVRHLSAFAPPLRAKLVPDLGPRRLLNYAFVDFRNEEDCNKVIQQGNNTLFRGLPIRIEFARGDRTIVLASPGNVDLEILKEADESGTYTAEFRQERVRWRSLTEELAERLCRPFGGVERIQAGLAAIGEAVIHVTFEYREEARLAYAAFGSLPLKAHLSVHWLNSPNLTAASHQPRRPLHPHGPHAPASGLPRGPLWAGGHFDKDDGQLSSPTGPREAYPTFQDAPTSDAEEDTAGTQEIDSVKDTATGPDGQNPPQVNSAAQTQIKSQPAGPQQQTRNERQVNAQSPSHIASDKATLSKSAIKRQKRLAKRLIRESQGSVTPDSNAPVTPATPVSLVDSNTSYDAQHGHYDQFVALPFQGSAEAIHAGVQPEPASIAPTVEPEGPYLLPTTRSEISIRGDQSLECPSSRDSGDGLHGLHFLASPSSAEEEVEHRAPNASGEVLGQDLTVQQGLLNDVDTWPTHSSNLMPLASTPQPNGLVAVAGDAEDTDHGSGEHGAPQQTTFLVPEEPQQDFAFSHEGGNLGMQRSHTENWSAQSDDGHAEANKTIPLVTRRRPGFTVADISLPTAVAQPGPTVDQGQPIDFAVPSPVPPIIEEPTAAAAEEPAQSPVGLVADTSTDQPPPTSNGSLATLVPAEGSTEKEIIERGCSIWVGNLPVDITPSQLYTMFSSCGSITDVDIKNSLQKTSKFAFIMFADRESVERALELDGQHVHGVKITVRKRAIKQIWVAPRLMMMPVALHPGLPPAPLSLPPCPNAHMPMPMPVPARPPKIITPGGSHYPNAEFHQAQALQNATAMPGVYPGMQAGFAASNGATEMQAAGQPEQGSNFNEPIGNSQLGSEPRAAHQPSLRGRKGLRGGRERGKFNKARNGAPPGQRVNKDVKEFAPNGAVAQQGEVDRNAQQPATPWNGHPYRSMSQHEEALSAAYARPAQAQQPKSQPAVQHPTPTTAQSQTLQDSAIVSSSEAQASPVLHYRSGSIYYPGGFYPAGAAPNTPFTTHSGGEYFYGGYSPYLYAPYISGQMWSYPYHVAAQPGANGHPVHVAQYSEVEARASAHPISAGGAYAHSHAHTHAHAQAHAQTAAHLQYLGTTMPATTAAASQASYYIPEYPHHYHASTFASAAATPGIMTAHSVSSSEGFSPIPPTYHNSNNAHNATAMHSANHGSGATLTIPSTTVTAATAPTAEAERTYSSAYAYGGAQATGRRGGRGRGRGFDAQRNQQRRGT